MKRALLIPAEGTPTTTMVMEAETYEFIRQSVGGWFDCVRSDEFHAYVNDTGLIDGLPFNPVASIMFGQVICGDAVVFGSFNAQGEYDGEEHAIDPKVVEAVKRQYLLYMANANERQSRDRVGL